VVSCQVGKHVFEQALKGLLAGKTIILATNQLQFVPGADHVVREEPNDRLGCGGVTTS
jgi:hypothetical protein